MDRYLRVPRFRPGQINRPRTVFTQAGGKGINAARTAWALGAETRLLGHACAPVRDGIDELGLAARWSHSRHTRQCLCILDESTGELTELYEPIPSEPPDAWPQLHRMYRHEISTTHHGDIVTISGRLPDGMPKTALKTLVSTARDNALTVLVDTDDPGLGDALRARPSIVKINASEASKVTRTPVTDPRSASIAARTLYEQGAQTAIITLGDHGCVYFNGDQAPKHLLTPSLPAPLAVGSGDAFLAGLACGLLAQSDLDESVRLAAATATATASRFVVGDIDRDTVTRVLPEIPAPRWS